MNKSKSKTPPCPPVSIRTSGNPLVTGAAGVFTVRMNLAVILRSGAAKRGGVNPRPRGGS